MELVEPTVAYPNLRAEMARLGIKQKDIAMLLDRSTDWVDLRLRGKSAIPVSDALKIKNEFFKSISFEYLFSEAVIFPSEILDR